MDLLINDCIIHLIQTMLDNHCYDILSSFLVSRKIKFLSDFVINNKLKINYKILIRNNNLINPLLSYHDIDKIYLNKFCLSCDKLTELILLSIKNNNIELLKIFCVTVPNCIKSSKNILEDPWIKTGYKYASIIELFEKFYIFDDYNKLLHKNNNIISKYENFIESF